MLLFYDIGGYEKYNYNVSLVNRIYEVLQVTKFLGTFISLRLYGFFGLKAY